jgi:hypothetical protein
MLFEFPREMGCVFVAEKFRRFLDLATTPQQLNRLLLGEGRVPYTPPSTGGLIASKTWWFAGFNPFLRRCKNFRHLVT